MFFFLYPLFCTLNKLAIMTTILAPSYGQPLIDNYTDAAVNATERSKLMSFNCFLKEYPHIFSHVNVEIRHNQLLDNKTVEQMNRNLKVRLIGTPKFASQINCNLYYPRGRECKPETPSLVFKSGNSDVPACQPSCFKITGSRVDEDGVPFRAPMAFFDKDQGTAIMQSDAIYRLAVDDYARTDAHLTTHVDTIGTGFDVPKDEYYMDTEGNKTYKIALNRYYCDDFMLEFRDGECKPSAAEFWVGIFVSSALYKAMQYGARYFATGVPANGIQKVKLDPIRTKAQTEAEWRAIINQQAVFFNPNLSLSDLGITADESFLIFTTEYGWPGRLVVPLIFYKTPEHDKYLQIDYELLNAKRLPQFAMTRDGRRIYDEYDLMGQTSAMLRNQVLEQYSDENDAAEHMKSWFASMIERIEAMLKSSEFYLIAGAAIGPQIILTQMRKLIKSLLRTAMPKLTVITMNVLAHSLGMSIAARLALTLARVGTFALKFSLATIKALSVIGLVFDGLVILDLFDLAFDFFSTKNLRDPSYPEAISELDLTVREKQFGWRSPECSPIYIISLIKTARLRDTKTDVDPLVGLTLLLRDSGPNPLLTSSDEQPVTFADAERVVGEDDDAFLNIFWQTEYLARLKTNSRGEPIIDPKEISMTKFDEAADNVLTNYPTTYNNYKAYSSDALKRVSVLRKLLITGLFSVGVALLMPTLLLTLVCVSVLAIVAIVPLLYYNDLSDVLAKLSGNAATSDDATTTSAA